MVAWLFILSVLLLLAPIASAGEGGYVDELIEAAQERRLHKERKWHALLHYMPSLLHDHKSVVDDPDFFLSQDGKTDPGAELAATLKAFFSTDVAGDEHPQCKFVARYEWLRSELGFDESRLPPNECVKFKEYMEHINPRSAVLIFPESYMNSPASMFGHTLIRIDSKYESHLLSYAVNYSAVASDADIFYALKGIFGGYKGYFSILPYYEKINEYTHMDNRDIWEYRLNLSEEEVRAMAYHIWELNDIYADYYFFDDNCSYILLFLIEAARPNVSMTDTFFWVIPNDTVRTVTEKGLINEIEYRPSRATKISYIESITPENNRITARDIALGRSGTDEILNDNSIANDDKIKTLDLSSEYLQYLFAKQKVEKGEYSGRLLEILSARSTLGKLSYSVPTPARPDKGHGSSRLALGAGLDSSRGYTLLGLRPAYHDILDPGTGYKPGAAISFMDTEIRYFPSDNDLYLDKLTFVDIKSLTPSGTFFRPRSWKVSAGIEAEKTDKDQRRTLLALRGGGGISLQLSRMGIVYGMIDPSLKFGGGLQQNYAFGGGISAGFIIDVNRAWKVNAEMKGLTYMFGDRHEAYSASLNQMFQISTNTSIKLNMTRWQLDKHFHSDINISLNYYL
jgi:hypothetical protein